MAELNENLIKFGWLEYDEMLQAIKDGQLDSYDICFTKDTHEQYLISSSLEPISIKSRLRLYGSVEAAIADIQETTETYEGEILSIRDGDKFIAYVVNKFPSGDYYISPICSDGQVDYNDLQNTPIKNLDGTVINPIVLTDLQDGHYKITGHFITPKGTEVTSIVGNYIIVEKLNINEKLIKRISNDSIFDYYVKSDGTYTVDKYATEKYIKEQGFVTEDDVDAKLAALRTSLEEYIREYVASTVELLVRHMIDEELDSRYAEKKDIENLFS